MAKLLKFKGITDEGKIISSDSIKVDKESNGFYESVWLRDELNTSRITAQFLTETNTR